ncbi:5076_t:CDS:1, partial [Paraglomus occultum]
MQKTLRRNCVWWRLLCGVAVTPLWSGMATPPPHATGTQQKRPTDELLTA